MRFSEVIEGCSVERVLRVVEGRCVKVQSTHVEEISVTARVVD